MKKSQQKKLYTTLVVAVVVIIIGFFTWYLVSARDTAMPNSMTNNSMDPARFATLTGDEFDKAYLADMLAHHEGAVNMAEMIGPGTERQELRDFGQQIIEVQSQEMIKMRTWQTDWGYPVTYAGHGSHSGGSSNDMAAHMMDMGEELMGMSGPQFEERFLELMIEHHQQAVDMSVYAADNAKHQEIKDLAADIISAQNSEIDQMKRWLSAWGYADMYSAR